MVYYKYMQKFMKTVFNKSYCSESEVFSLDNQQRVYCEHLEGFCIYATFCF